MTHVCQVCKQRVATIDGKLLNGPWCYMCDDCHKLLGMGLGLGRGSRLKMTDNKEPLLTVADCNDICKRYAANTATIDVLAKEYKTSRNCIRMLTHSKFMAAYVDTLR